MDVQYARQRSSLSSVCPATACNPALGGVIPNPAVNVIFGDSPQFDWFATLRSRYGVTISPDALVYATGGLAVSEITTVGTIFGFLPSVDFNGNPIALPANTVFGQHTRKAGWTAGGGLEAHLGGNWTGKVEYLYLDFGTAEGSTFNFLNSTPIALLFHTRVIDHVARAGLNYKFD
jgi:opacity protein-like surface antigen